MSLFNSSTVVFICNLKTGRIIPKYHVVYDSNLETMYSNNENPSEIWTELIIFRYFISDYDTEDYIPELYQ